MKNLRTLGLLVLVSNILTGCVTTSQQSATMDEYDPRNNIPLLQAATKSVPAPVISSESAGSPGPQQKPSTSMQKLRELKILRDEGVLSPKEYEAKKADVLKSY